MNAAEPARRIAVRAPGRVNLIGDHTDYNDGFVLPIAIDLECRVTGTTRTDERVRLVWEDDADANSDRLATAVAEALGRRGRPPVGLDATVASTVPIGGGLSSSAALSVALATALCAAADFELPGVELARACREAESIATAVPIGIMDPLVSIAGRAGCALLIDCRSLQLEPISLPESVGVLVVHSGVRRLLAGSEYARRRVACEAVARRLGVAALRDAAAEDVAGEPVARHVVSENARVLAAALALRTGDIERVGALMHESHVSLRDDFGVSLPELDLLVELLEEAGAFGARLTGAGFGGAVVALAPRGEAERIAADATSRYVLRSGLRPTFSYVCRAVDGAGVTRRP